MYQLGIYALYLVALLGSFVIPFYAPATSVTVVLIGAALFYWVHKFLQFAASSPIIKAYAGKTHPPEFTVWLHRYLRNSMLHALGFISVCGALTPIWAGAGIMIVLLLPIMGLYFLMYEGTETKTAP